MFTNDCKGRSWARELKGNLRNQPVSIERERGKGIAILVSGDGAVKIEGGEKDGWVDKRKVKSNSHP